MTGTKLAPTRFSPSIYPSRISAEAASDPFSPPRTRPRSHFYQQLLYFWQGGKPGQGVPLNGSNLEKWIEPGSPMAPCSGGELWGKWLGQRYLAEVILALALMYGMHTAKKSSPSKENWTAYIAADLLCYQTSSFLLATENKRPFYFIFKCAWQKSCYGYERTMQGTLDIKCKLFSLTQHVRVGLWTERSVNCEFMPNLNCFVRGKWKRGGLWEICFLACFSSPCRCCLSSFLYWFPFSCHCLCVTCDGFLLFHFFPTWFRNKKWKHSKGEYI